MSRARCHRCGQVVDFRKNREGLPCFVIHPDQTGRTCFGGGHPLASDAYLGIRDHIRRWWLLRKGRKHP